MTRSMRLMFLLLIAALATNVVSLRVKNDALAASQKTEATP